jgi:peptide/nickel transport system substrate-binding protein/oligopeptide transport system substrate-binding protein
MRLMALLAAAAAVAIVAVSAADASPSAGAAAVHGTAVAVAKAGGRVSIEETAPDFLTPNRSTSAFDEDHALFTPLMELNAKNQLVKGAAQSLTSSHGGRVWTIAIKKGWRFQNGEPVTAHSFVDAWNATAYGPNGWGNNGELANIAGYPALNPKSGKPKAKTLSGLQVLSPTKFRVTLIKPDSQFPLELTGGQLGFYPLPKAAYKNLSSYDKAPIGNGPFEMVGKYQPNVGLTVRRWAGYKGPKPHVDELEFKVYSDVHTAYNDVLAGNLDITFVGNDELAKAQTDFPGRFRSYDAPAIDNLDFPLYDSRFKDPRLREAISMAIDRHAISKALFGGVLTPATDWVPASVPGARPGKCGGYCTYNPAKAKQLLRAAGGWSGTMNIWYPGGIGYDPLFQAIGNDLRQNLGITVAYQTPPGFGPFFQDLGTKKVDGPSRGHWGALYPSMENTLFSLYTPAGGAGYEETYFSDPIVTGDVAKGNAASSLKQAISWYQKADNRVAQDFPTAPLFNAKYDYVFSKRVSGVVIDVNQIELNNLRVVG